MLRADGKPIGIFDHPLVPAIIIIAWAIGMMMGMLLLKIGGYLK